MKNKFQTVLGLLGLILLLSGCGCSIVDPGHRGVKVHLGEVSPQALPEGLVWHQPMVTTIHQISIQQQTQEMKAECYSSDLQQVEARLQVLYRIPENDIVSIYQKYSGDPFASLVAPRINESLKEVTAGMTAEQIVKNREKVKMAALAGAKAKIGDIIYIEDIVIENINLTKQLEHAIEEKMVQQQEAAKAEFTKQKAKVEAETAAIRAQGEADAIRIRGAALKENSKLIELQIVEKWDGHTPQVVGGSGGSGANILLPIGEHTAVGK